MQLVSTVDRSCGEEGRTQNPSDSFSLAVRSQSNYVASVGRPRVRGEDLQLTDEAEHVSDADVSRSVGLIIAVFITG